MQLKNFLNLCKIIMQYLCVLVAQQDRVLVSEAEGHGFESRQARFNKFIEGTYS